MPNLNAVWLACTHCGKATALVPANAVNATTQIAWCSKDCLEAYKLTHRLTEGPPATRDKETDDQILQRRLQAYAQIQAQSSAKRIERSLQDAVGLGSKIAGGYPAK